MMKEEPAEIQPDTLPLPDWTKRTPTKGRHLVLPSWLVGTSGVTKAAVDSLLASFRFGLARLASFVGTSCHVVFQDFIPSHCSGWFLSRGIRKVDE